MPDTCDGSVRRAASVAVNERSSSQSTLDVSDVETTLAEHCTLLISYLQQHPSAHHIRQMYHVQGVTNYEIYKELISLQHRVRATM